MSAGGADWKADTFEEAMDLVHTLLKDLMIKKQMDYGSQNILKFGEMGVIVRMNDKLERLANLVKSGRKPENELLDDTYLDIANYAIIALMLRHGIFDLPLDRKPLPFDLNIRPLEDYKSYEGTDNG